MRDPVVLARDWLFVREHGGQNCGVWVGVIQRVTGNEQGDSWCASFVSLILGLAFYGGTPLLRTGSTVEMLTAAREKGWVVMEPSVGDLFFYVHDDGTPHHVGFVTQTAPLFGIAGNTSVDGTSSNGDRVAEHPIVGNIVFVHYQDGDAA